MTWSLRESCSLDAVRGYQTVTRLEHLIRLGLSAELCASQGLRLAAPRRLFSTAHPPICPRRCGSYDYAPHIKVIPTGGCSFSALSPHQSFQPIGASTTLAGPAAATRSTRRRERHCISTTNTWSEGRWFGLTPNAEVPRVIDGNDHAAEDETTIYLIRFCVPAAGRRTCEDSDVVGPDCGASAGAAVSSGLFESLHALGRLVGVASEGIWRTAAPAHRQKQ